ncbi:MAG TPA: DNA mismatch repair endonuclease MutL [Candidatus Acidoferrales bacterium]|nr:DNA mismatch repair endonuclease MutL [Candidatus Acidoferrales bacterium]
MSRIRILAENVANKIAAGEVIERPASVVKELLENALDAGARSIRVEAESGGKRLIRVIDDGCGMNHDDALLAFERHATSKLQTADDLLSIETLGFRGEALPSIAAVSRLLLETRTAEEEQGTEVEFAGGKLVGVKPRGVPPGTSISVADIFYCVPARRKFLKSESTELGHLASLVTHYALAHPEVQFQLKTPSQVILECTPVERLSDRIYQVFGRQALDELIEIPGSEGPVRPPAAVPELNPDEHGGRLGVGGFTSRPDVQRTNRNGIYIFVNRRLVRDRLLLHAIGEAYRNVMPAGVFPVVLLFLDLPYQDVDVNVHPAKIEVRFRHPQLVHDFTRDAVRHALSKARPIPGFPAARAAAATAAVTSSLRRDPSLVPDAGVFSPVDIPTTPGSSAPFELSGAPDRPFAERLGFSSDRAMHFPLSYQAAMPPFSEASTSASLPSPEAIAELRPLGQVNASFIVAVSGEGLWIIDQHVAHERVLFEQHLQARHQGEVGGQRLLAPILVELNPRQLATFELIDEELRANGFEANLIGAHDVAIQATPAGIASGDAEKLLFEVLDGIARENQAISIDSLQAKIAASTACHAAIKVNTPLDAAKMQWLLGELAKTEYPMSCPHGRPVVLHYSVREIERAFKRN